MLWFKFLSVLLASVILLAQSSFADKESDNFHYVEKIVEMLNNRETCLLPDYDAIDELSLRYNELKQIYGDTLESKLNYDQLMLVDKVLYQWDSFHRLTKEGIVIRSAKQRAFLGKIESYQVAKFGESICAGVVISKKATIEELFERNPITRYLKHLETNQVIDRPADGATNADVSSDGHEAEANLMHNTNQASEFTSDELAKQTNDVDTLETLDQDKANSLLADKNDEQSGANQADEELTPTETDLVTIEPDQQQVDQLGVAHRLIGSFTVDYNKLPCKLIINLQPESTCDVDYDPLSAIPAPSADDDTNEEKFHEEQKSKQDEDEDEATSQTNQVEAQTEKDGESTRVNTGNFVGNENNAKQDEQHANSLDNQNSEPNQQAESEKTSHTLSVEDDTRAEQVSIESSISPEVNTNEQQANVAELQQNASITPEQPQPKSGQSYQVEYWVDLGDDDRDLERLARMPRLPWEFQPDKGYFRWPDEDQEEKLYGFDVGLREAWKKFTHDPVEFDLALEQKKNVEPGQNVRLSPAELARLKRVGMRERRVELAKEKLGVYNQDNLLPKFVSKPDKWVQIADNNFCKMAYNRNYVTKQTKTGYKAVKSGTKTLFKKIVG